MPKNPYLFANLLNGMIKASAAFDNNRKVSDLDDELGTMLGVNGRTIEGYRTGKPLPPDPTIVSVLARHGVNRAMFDQRWLELFLDSAGYPDLRKQELIAELCGPRPAAGRNDLWEPNSTLTSVEWRDNLDGPFATEFVPRQGLMRRLLQELRRSSVTLLLSMGGMGKTRLAHQVALLCRDQGMGKPNIGGKLPGPLPQVKGVVWISDQFAPGSLTLYTVLDSILHTFDVAGISTSDLGKQFDQVGQLLRKSPILLVVDNAETITDQTLLNWLLKPVGGTRVLITSRLALPEMYAPSVGIVRVEPMTDPEARRLIKATAPKHARGLETTRGAQLLIESAGGCPQVIQQLVGYAGQTGQPLEQVAQRFDALTDDILQDLFEHIWSTQLGFDEQALLLALSLFHNPASRAILAEVAQLAEAKLANSVAALQRFALVEVQYEYAPQLVDEAAGIGQPDVNDAFDEQSSRRDEPSGVRLSMHPLTRQFVRAWAERHPEVAGPFSERLLGWVINYAGSFGYRLSNLTALKELERDDRTMFAAVDLALARHEYEAVCKLVRGIEFMLFSACRWKDKLELHMIYLYAAEQLGDVNELVNALAMHVQLLTRLRRLDEAYNFLMRLNELSTDQRLIGASRYHIGHAWGLYYYYQTAYDQAQRQWETILSQIEAWGLPEAHRSVGALHWLGLSYYQRRLWNEAGTCFEQALTIAREHNLERWIARNLLQKALVMLRNNQLHERATITPLIEEARVRSPEIDREQWARIRRAELWWHHAYRREKEARAAYHDAHDLFVRIGMLHEFATEIDQFGTRYG